MGGSTRGLSGGMFPRAMGGMFPQMGGMFPQMGGNIPP